MSSRTYVRTGHMTLCVHNDLTYIVLTKKSFIKLFFKEIIGGVEGSARVGRGPGKMFLYDIVNNTRSGLDVDKIGAKHCKHFSPFQRHSLHCKICCHDAITCFLSRLFSPRFSKHERISGQYKCGQTLPGISTHPFCLLV